VRPGYKNFYAYSAVCPATGEDFTLLLPWVNTDMMNLFLAGMAERLGGRRCILGMDRAGWHVSKELKVPPNMRLWRWVKRDTILNRLHLTLESVEDAAGAYMGAATADFFRSVCRCDYL
jgi:hypothetical protein